MTALMLDKMITATLSRSLPIRALRWFAHVRHFALAQKNGARPSIDFKPYTYGQGLRKYFTERQLSAPLIIINCNGNARSSAIRHRSASIQRSDHTTAT